MDEDKGILESVVLTIVAIVLIMPYIILSAIPMSDGIKLMVIAMSTIPFMFVYLTIMFRLIDWSDKRRADHLQKEVI